MNIGAYYSLLKSWIYFVFTRLSLFPSRFLDWFQLEGRWYSICVPRHRRARFCRNVSRELFPRPISILRIFLLALAWRCLPGRLEAQIYIGYSESAAQVPAHIADYDPVTGAVLNSDLLPATTLSSAPYDLAISGNILYQTDWFDGKVGEYNLSTGATISTDFISGLNLPGNLTLVGNHLFVGSTSGGQVGEFDATTGAVISTSFINTGSSTTRVAFASGNNLYVENGLILQIYDSTSGSLLNPDLLTLTGFITISGNDLFMSNAYTLEEYDATTGALINADVMTISHDQFLSPTIVGDDLYYLDSLGGKVAEYDLSTGSEVNAFSIPNGPYGSAAVMAIAPAPEPGGGILFAMGAALAGGLWRRRSVRFCGSGRFCGGLVRE